MDFNEDFVEIQRTLNSARNIYGSLCDKAVSGDAKKTEDIVAKLAAVIHKKYKEFLIPKSGEFHDALKKIVFLLILNSDLCNDELLMSDEHIGHLIGSIPNMNRDLLFSILWGAGLKVYVYDFITHGSPALAIEMVNLLIDKQNSLNIFEGLEHCTQSIIALHTQLSKISGRGTPGKKVRKVWCRLMELLKMLTSELMEPDTKKFDGVKPKDLNYFAGLTIKTFLIICEHFLKTLEMNPKQYLITHPIYKTILDTNYSITDCEHKGSHRMDSISNVISEMLSACFVNLRGITVDLWLFWVECDEANGRNLQLDIAELCYHVSEALKYTENIDEIFPDLEELQVLLQNFARKPRSEEDDIKSADIETVLKNVVPGAKLYKLWWKALLAFDSVCDDEEALECIEKNLTAVDKNDVCRILDISTNTLLSAAGLSDTQLERLKVLAITAVNHLELPLQFEVLNYFLMKHGVTSILETKEFTKACTEHFNKSVESCEEEKNEEFMKQCIALCLQSTQNFLVKAMTVALENKRQQNVVILSLQALKGSLSTLTIEGDNIILRTINKIVCNKFLDDTNAENYICMIISLVNERLISGKLYVEKFLLPQIHEAASERELSSLLIWLQTLLIFVDGSVREGKAFNAPALLIMLAQLLENTTANIFTYTLKAIYIRQEVITIIQTLLNANADTLEEDIYPKWLHIKLKSFLAPVNIPYFKTLWKGEQFFANDKDIINNLVGAMHGIVDDNTVAELIRGSPQDNINILKAAVLQVLPPLTNCEWKLLYDCVEKIITILKPNSEVAVELFHIFSDVILIITTVINGSDISGKSLNFLDFCLHNLGFLIMEKVCPALTSENTDSGVAVFQKVIYIFDSLPGTVKNSLCPVWLNVCATLVENITSFQDIAGKNTTVRCLAVSLTAVSADNLKQPLAKKLLDVWNVCM